MFELSTVEDVAVLHLTGELNYQEVREIEGMLGKLMQSAKTKVVLNFQKVDHVNYKTLNTLLDGALKMRSLQGDLKCASLNYYTQNIFRFSGVDQMVESYDSVSEAVLSFHGGEEKHRTWH
ncbi:MAG: STAS domain-containing protein [bacterium]|nr:STAS domain-containing protein [bacterium]